MLFFIWIPNARESFSRLRLTSLIRRAERLAGQATSLCFRLPTVGTKTSDINSLVEIVQSLNSDCAIQMDLCNGERSKASWVKASRVWYSDKNFVADCLVFEIASSSY